MRRRSFIAVLGGAAAWPIAVRAQQPGISVIGRLNMGAANVADSSDDAFTKGLNDVGFVVGSNVAIEYRSADGQVERLPALTTELVQRKVAVIYGNLSVALAAKAATSTIPIVFVTTADPLAAGAVTSFNRPGGNVTGIRLRAGDEATAKVIELMRELLPDATTIGMLISPRFPDAQPGTAAVEAAARAVGFKVIILPASVESDFEPTLAQLAAEHARAVLLGDNIYFASLREPIIRLATRYRLPVFAGFRSFTAAGALASYGASDYDGIRQGGIYVGRILKGEKPGELPIVQPTKFDLVINLKVARSLHLTVPPALLARADEVIE